jgi:hypothetical protein
LLDGLTIKHVHFEDWHSCVLHPTLLWPSRPKQKNECAISDISIKTMEKFMEKISVIIRKKGNRRTTKTGDASLES